MKIGIIGSGFVGSTAAYAMVMNGIGREIVLVDRNAKRAEAEANDINHAVPFSHPLRVRSGDYADLDNSRVVIISAGVAQKPGETRLELLQRNADVFREVVPSVLKHAPDAVLVVASNPVDIMTHVAASIAADFGIDEQRILGTGTMLDTARFRTLLGHHFDIDSQHVHAYVIGEHGDSEVLPWSLATIGGQPLEEFARLQGRELNDSVRSQIDNDVRRAAYRIIEGKGATYYGVGSAIARVTDAILNDQRSIMTVCSRVADVDGIFDVTLSQPCVVGGAGVLGTIPLNLNSAEATAFRDSASIIQQATNSL